MTRNQHPNWQPRHITVLLWILMNPGGKQYECAKATGYSRWQVSRIVNSPDFKAKFAEAMDRRMRHAVVRLLGG